jgi:hypothetical protein
LTLKRIRNFQTDPSLTLNLWVSFDDTLVKSKTIGWFGRS